MEVKIYPLYLYLNIGGKENATNTNDVIIGTVLWHNVNFVTAMKIVLAAFAAVIFGQFAVPYASVYGSADAKRLYDDLLSNYNRLIRPVGNNSDRLTVKMGLKLSQLIEVVSNP